MRVRHRRQDRLGAFHFLLRRREYVIGELDLTGMDGPLAFAAQDGRPARLRPEALRILVIAEGAADRHDAVRARRLHQTEQGIVPEIVPVTLAPALLVL